MFNSTSRIYGIAFKPSFGKLKLSSRGASIGPTVAQSYLRRFKDYDSLIKDAKRRAKNTILVDQAGQHTAGCLEFYNGLLDVHKIYHIEKSQGQRVSLIEFTDHQAMRKATFETIHRYGMFPMPSRMFSLINRKSQPTQYDGGGKVAPLEQNNTNKSSDGCDTLSADDDDDDKLILCKCQHNIEKINISKMKQLLVNNFFTLNELLINSRMCEYALKLRFFTLSQLEEVLCTGLFKEYELLPFGSSVIDIGNNFGDLDILMTRKNFDSWYVENLKYQHQNSNSIDISFEEALDCIRSKKKPTDNNDASGIGDGDDDDGYNRDNNDNNITSVNANLDTLSYPASAKLFHYDRDFRSLSERYCKERGIKLLGENLRLFMPSIKSETVTALSKARVPIVKFNFELADVDCDLSLNLGFTISDKAIDHCSGILMSKILFAVCGSNNIFTSFTTCIRLFSKLRQITSNVPNQGFTNFQLLSLIIFYLQQQPVPPKVISWLSRKQQRHQRQKPPHDNLITTTTTDNNTDYKSVKNIDQKHHQPQNLLLPLGDIISDNYSYNPQHRLIVDQEILGEILPSLILDFFKFYSRFPYRSSHISLYKGTILRRKLEGQHEIGRSPAIYVENPLDRDMNICANVSDDAVNHFVKQCRRASSCLSEYRRDKFHFNKCLIKVLRNIQASSQDRDEANENIAMSDLASSLIDSLR